MSDNKSGNSDNREVDILIRNQSIANEIVNIGSEEQFNQIIRSFPDKIIVIVFWATWCAPCKRYALIFAETQQEFSMDYIFAKINVDEYPVITQFFGITSIPTTVLTKGNQVLRKFVGAINLETLRQILENFKS